LPEDSINLDSRLGDLELQHDETGELFVEHNGQRYSPSQYLELVESQQQHRDDGGPIFVLFNITTVLGLVWVGMGLLGQAMFSGRMIVQWLASEKAGRSTLPLAFWWLSLIGSILLLAYFIWRKDIVGILGQVSGLLIYIRNLTLMRQSPT
jgi:lipid-A-disaccharide synthase-like uncharacterized protein